ncbi:MAG: methyltransferase domain-containing protein [Deltaproteobacteria bacterium]|nr:methyltransferase domain-containing protein [Deltaproteobacteria bacterium]
MEVSFAREPLNLNPEVENEIRLLLKDHYESVYHEHTENYVNSLLSLVNYECRYQYLQSVIGNDSFRPESRIFVSGFSVGSEMIVARQFGFGKIYGAEVDLFLVNVCRKRLSQFPDMYPVHYDGNTLPYENEQFDVLVSGHIVEHTRVPELYLKECMRVIASGGYLFLEFPTRYHYKELHTLLPSFEWLPRLLRNGVLLTLSSRISPLNRQKKERFRCIVTTKLKQISMWQIRYLLMKNGYRPIVLNSNKAAPGIIRCVLQKRS